MSRTVKKREKMANTASGKKRKITSLYFDEQYRMSLEEQYPTCNRAPLKPISCQFVLQRDLKTMIEEHTKRCYNPTLRERFPEILQYFAEDIFGMPCGQSNSEVSYYQKRVQQALSSVAIPISTEIPAVERVFMNGHPVRSRCGFIDLMVYDWIVELKARKYQTTDFAQLRRYVNALRSQGDTVKGGIVLCFEPHVGVDLRVFNLDDFGSLDSDAN